MRFSALLVLCCLVSPLFADGPSKKNLQGKTPEQVVQMGRDKWFKFFTGKVGDSTASMSGAERLYGDSLKYVNDKTIVKLPKAKRDAIGRLRQQLDTFHTELINLGDMLSGGGTMWNPVYAGVLADNEEAIAVFIGRAKPIKHGSTPEAAINLLDRYLDANADDIREWGETEFRSVAKCKGKIAFLRSALSKLEATAAAVHPKGREWIRASAAKAVTGVQSMLGGDV